MSSIGWGIRLVYGWLGLLVFCSWRAAAADCWVHLSDLNDDGVLDAIVSEDTQYWGNGGGLYEVRLSRDGVAGRVRFDVWGAAAPGFSIERRPGRPLRLWSTARLTSERGCTGYADLLDPERRGGFTHSRREDGITDLDDRVFRALREVTDPLPFAMIEDYPAPYVWSAP